MLMNHLSINIRLFPARTIIGLLGLALVTTCKPTVEETSVTTFFKNLPGQELNNYASKNNRDFTFTNQAVDRGLTWRDSPTVRSMPL